MGIFVLCVIVFAVLTLFPFVLVYRIKFQDGESTSLVIRSDNVKNPRYFSDSFKKMLMNSLPEGRNIATEIQLSKKEEIYFPSGQKSIAEKVDKICYMVNEMNIEKAAEFQKEVYAEKRVEFAPDTTVRAVAGEDAVILGEGCNLLRWADGEKLLAVKKNSRAGTSVASGNHVVLEVGCSFTRAYAPIIEVCNYMPILDSMPMDIVIYKNLPVYMKVKKNIKYVAAGSYVKNTIITKYNLCVDSGAVVYGDIKSSKRVHIKQNVVVTGNIFADKSIILENGVTVLGNIFAEEALYIGSGVQIGKLGRIKSAVARMDLYVSFNSSIYGYLGTEAEGRTVTEEEFARIVLRKESIDIAKGSFAIPEKYEEAGYIKLDLEEDGAIRFHNLEEYESMDYYAFRSQNMIRKVYIPQGAAEIWNSMFYQCEQLETVYIPASVKEIGDYAFFGCTHLKEVIIEENSALKRVGSYAFSKCSSLIRITFPGGIEELGIAAFREDTALEEINAAGGKTFHLCGSHAFQYCTHLKSIPFIKDWKKIPESCFYGCTALKNPTIPDSIAEVEDYAFAGCDMTLK